MGCVFDDDLPDEPKTPPVYGFDVPLGLAVVPDGSSSGLDPATQRRIRYDFSLPDRAEYLLFRLKYSDFQTLDC